MTTERWARGRKLQLCPLSPTRRHRRQPLEYECRDCSRRLCDCGDSGAFHYTTCPLLDIVTAEWRKEYPG